MAEPAGRDLRSQSGTRRVTRSQQASLQSSQEDLAASAHTVNGKTEGCQAKTDSSNLEKPDSSSQVPECAVCLQTCVHPVKLPCSHIFCYLCVKGVAFQSRRCAMCRQEIPADVLLHPQLLDRTQLEKETSFEDGYQWFYEGRNGKSSYIPYFKGSHLILHISTTLRISLLFDTRFKAGGSMMTEPLPILSTRLTSARKS